MSTGFSYYQNPDIYKIKKPILTCPSLLFSHQLFLCNIFLIVSNFLSQLFSARQKMSHQPPQASQTAPVGLCLGSPAHGDPARNHILPPNNLGVTSIIVPNSQMETVRLREDK